MDRLVAGFPAAAFLLADYDEQVRPALEDSVARLDDRSWSAFVEGPFSWRRFTTWWVARRWVMPRDVRKEWR